MLSEAAIEQAASEQPAAAPEPIRLICQGDLLQEGVAAVGLMLDRHPNLPQFRCILFEYDGLGTLTLRANGIANGRRQAVAKVPAACSDRNAPFAIAIEHQSLRKSLDRFDGDARIELSFHPDSPRPTCEITTYSSTAPRWSINALSAEHFPAKLPDAAAFSVRIPDQQLVQIARIFPRFAASSDSSEARYKRPVLNTIALGPERVLATDGFGLAILEDPDWHMGWFAPMTAPQPVKVDVTDGPAKLVESGPVPAPQEITSVNVLADAMAVLAKPALRRCKSQLPRDGQPWWAGLVWEREQAWLHLCNESQMSLHLPLYDLSKTFPDVLSLLPAPHQQRVHLEVSMVDLVDAAKSASNLAGDERDVAVLTASHPAPAANQQGELTVQVRKPEVAEADFPVRAAFIQDQDIHIPDHAEVRLAAGEFLYLKVSTRGLRRATEALLESIARQTWAKHREMITVHLFFSSIESGMFLGLDDHCYAPGSVRGLHLLQMPFASRN